MTDIEEMIAEFVSEITRGPFRCLRDDASDGTSEYVVNHSKAFDDIYECAVYQAYLDMCRTIPGVGKDKKKEKAAEKMRDLVARSLKDYFEGEPKTKEGAFDGWHGSAMHAFSVPLRITCGQAQKILNMAFKYLYCCKDMREGHAKHFECCHMPLDGYTLAWYSRECDAQYDGEAWSSIDDVAKYGTIEGRIREKLQGKNALLAEFVIWAEEKARAERDDARRAALKVAAFDECPDALKEQLEAFANDLLS